LVHYNKETDHISTLSYQGYIIIKKHTIFQHWVTQGTLL